MENEYNDMYIYPLSSKDEETIGMIGDKYSYRSTDIDFELVMSILKQIFHYSCFETVSEENSLQESGNSFPAGTDDLPDKVRDIVNQLTSLIKRKYDPEMEVQEPAIHMMDVLLNYTWEAKILLILAAFVASFGEFSFHLLQRAPENPLANLLAMLYKRPVLKTSWEQFPLGFMTLSNLVSELFEVCLLMIQFKKDRDQRKVPDTAMEVRKVLLMVTYQFLKIVVTCSSYMEAIIMECSTSVIKQKELAVKELHDGRRSTSNIYRQKLYFKELLDTHQFITEYLSSINTASQKVPTSSQTKYHNIHEFIAKFFTKEKSLNGGKISLKELNGNSTAFLITDLNVSIDLTALKQMYGNIHKEKNFKVVWVPMVDKTVEWTDTEEETFREISRSMPWYYCHPSMVTEAFYTHMVEEWHYQKNPALVVLDDKANVVNNNALLLVETLGAAGFPFFEEVEANKSEKWTMHSLVEDMGILKTDWENEIVCVYGGCNLEMLKSFIEKIKQINTQESTKIKAVYVGTREQNGNLKTITQTLEEMNETCLNENQMSTFWNRLGGVMKSKMGNSSAYVEDDAVKQLTTLLEGGGNEIWTTLAYKGSEKFAGSKEGHLLQSSDTFSEPSREVQKTNDLLKSILQDLESEINNKMFELTYLHAHQKVQEFFKIENQDVHELLVKLFTQEMALNGGQIGLQELKGKSVGFLLTELTVAQDELTSLAKSYNKLHLEKGFKLVWIPLVDASEQWTNRGREMFQDATSCISWYWCEPSMLTKDFLTYIRQEWYKERKPILVVLDSHGKLISKHLVEKWDASAFPSYLLENLPVAQSFELSARDLLITWGGDSRYWHWPLMEFESSNVTVAELLNVCWLDVVGKFNTSNLSQNTMYEISFVAKMKDYSYGWEVPVRLWMKPPNGEEREHSQNLRNKSKGRWFEIIVGQYLASPDKTGELEFRLYEINGGQWKKGLIIKGVVVRPLLENSPPPQSFELSAQDLLVTWGGDSRYWRWPSMDYEASNTIVAELLNVCWLAVVGKFNTSNLSQNTTYEISFVVKMATYSYGWEVPVRLWMKLPSGEQRERSENLRNKPKERWFEIIVGDVHTSHDLTGEMEFKLYEINGGQWKRGLIIKGVVLRPKN